MIFFVCVQACNFSEQSNMSWCLGNSWCMFLSLLCTFSSHKCAVKIPEDLLKGMILFNPLEISCNKMMPPLPCFFCILCFNIFDVFQFYGFVWRLGCNGLEEPNEQNLLG